MRNNCYILLFLMVALVLYGCSEQPESYAAILIEETVLQEDQIPVSAETEAPTMLSVPETVATVLEEMVTPEAVPVETSVVYSVVDEYVYAITDVNIRGGPGTQFKVLDYLPAGKEINRIAIGTDGWSQVYYKGDGAYIRSKYLSYEKPKAKPASVGTEKVSQKTERPVPPNEEDFESVEEYVESAPVIIPQTPAEPAPVVPQAPVIQPTEAPPYVEPERIDTSALTAHGNSFAASLGFTIDYGVRDGYFPPDTIRFSSMNAAYSNVEENVMVLYNNIVARDGSIDGYRCCVTVSDNGDSTYTTTVYYG